MRSVLLVAAVGMLFAGCRTYPAAPAGMGHNEVFEAAAAAVKDRYPMAAIYPKSDSVFALGPVEMNGGSKVQKQVHVWVRKTYTGYYQPEVTVRLLAQVNETPPGPIDPAAENIPAARPVGTVPEWRSLQRLQNEEVELYNAIYARLNEG